MPRRYTPLDSLEARRIQRLRDAGIRLWDRMWDESDTKIWDVGSRWLATGAVLYVAVILIVNIIRWWLCR
jgi:hypothetical protein